MTQRFSMVAGLCISSFRGEKTPREKTKRQKNAMQKKKKKKKKERNEKSPCEKRKRRNNAMRKDEKTKPATRKDEILARKDKKKKKKTPCEKTPFDFLILSSRVASFRLALIRREKIKRRHAKGRNNARWIDEKMPCEKTKRWRDATRKDDKTKVSNGVFSNGVFSSFRAKISSFRVAVFLFFLPLSHGVISSFRLFTWHFFRLFIFSHGAFSSFRVASFRREKTKWQSSHHIFELVRSCVLSKNFPSLKSILSAGNLQIKMLISGIWWPIRIWIWTLYKIIFMINARDCYVYPILIWTFIGKRLCRLVCNYNMQSEIKKNVNMI